MKSIAVIQENKLQIIDIETPKPGPYQALVKTKLAYICNSTDVKLLQGKFPDVNKYPFILGHEGVGIVERVGDKVVNFKPGNTVIGGLHLFPQDKGISSAWGGFSEYTIVNDHLAMTSDNMADEKNGWLEVYEIQKKMDEDISLEHAEVFNTWREVYGGFSDFNIKNNDTLLIFGCGPVGLSFLTFARAKNPVRRVIMIEPNQIRANKAKGFGADKVFTPETEEIEKYVQENGKFDVVVDAVGMPAIVNRALTLIKMGGSVCAYGGISKPEVSLDISKAPYNFNLYMHQWPTRKFESAAQNEICKLIRENKVEPDKFITAQFPIQEAEKAFEALKDLNNLKIQLVF